MAHVEYLPFHCFRDWRRVGCCGLLVSQPFSVRYLAAVVSPVLLGQSSRSCGGSSASEVNLWTSSLYVEEFIDVGSPPIALN